MARRRRPEIPGGTFHLFGRGNRKLDIFHTEGDRRQFLIHLALVVEHYGWQVLAWCLMHNHFHLLVRTPGGRRSAGMQSLNAGYARYYNDTYGHEGHLFQRPHGLTIADSDGEAMYLATYVLLNPVKAGMCKRPEDHPWSTVGTATVPPPLRTDHLTTLFGSTERLDAVLEAVRILGAAGFDLAAGLQKPSRWTSL